MIITGEEHPGTHPSIGGFSDIDYGKKDMEGWYG
jgi:hypothetical protein